jgi:hypothetical protein
LFVGLLSIDVDVAGNSNLGLLSIYVDVAGNSNLSLLSIDVDVAGNSNLAGSRCIIYHFGVLQSNSPDVQCSAKVMSGNTS